MIDRRARIIAKIAKRLRIDPVTGCHLWTGPDSGKKGRGAGYPRMSLGGQTVAVHLVVYTHYYGYIPGRKQVDHTCTRRMCCNPEHLELVTHKQNQKRKVRAITACSAPSVRASAVTETSTRPIKVSKKSSRSTATRRDRTIVESVMATT